MGLGHVQKARVNRSIKREIKSGGADAAGECAAERFRQVTAAEGEESFGVGVEETRRNFVLAAVEFAVPVRGELIVGVLTRSADCEGSGGRIAAGNQKAVAGSAKLITFEIEELADHGIDRRSGIAKKRLGDCGLGAVQRARGDRGADKSARRKTAALTGTLIVHEEIVK